MSSEVRIDNRLIVLNSEHAKRLNSSYNSNVLFEFPPLINDSNNVIHNSISIESVEIPHTFYNIDSNNNKINIKYERIALPPSTEIITSTQLITIPIGNYTATIFQAQFLSLFDELFGTTPIMSLKKTTGVYLFNPKPDDGNYSHRITFLSNGSTCFDVLGLAKQDKVFIHLPISQEPQFDFMCNFLGTKKINIYSEALASHNIASSALGECSLITSVSNSVPSFGLIVLNYLHTGNSHLKTKTLSQIDIQLRDDNGHLLNLNNIHWSMTINLITHSIKTKQEIQNIRFLEERAIDFNEPNEIVEEKIVDEEEPKEPKKSNELIEKEIQINLGITEDENFLFSN